MKKSKKNKPRPAWSCGVCGLYWVSCEPTCVLCGSTGKPLNAGAEKLLRKINNENIV